MARLLWPVRSMATQLAEVPAPHTEQLHTVERYTRLNYGTLVNRVTLEDPGGCAGLSVIRSILRLSYV